MGSARGHVGTKVVSFHKMSLSFIKNSIVVNSRKDLEVIASARMKCSAHSGGIAESCIHRFMS